MKIIKETCTKGCNIYLGNEKRNYINSCIKLLIDKGFEEIQIPILQNYDYFKNKVGEENNNMMYRFTDKGNRDLVLPPEYTSVIMSLKDTFKYQKDVRLFYVAECFRGENPQKGRFRQFTQLGIEIINPSKNYMLDDSECIYKLAEDLIHDCLLIDSDSTNTNLNVTRGLDYYKEGMGFEIICDQLGSSKQICGGGEYNGGIGFAIGIDRLLFK